MAKERAGKVQIATEVSPGLRQAAETRANQEGLSLSIVVRRALMFHLSVDAEGESITRAPGVTPEWEAFSAALGQHHIRVARALDQMSAAEIRELHWAATELATACEARRVARPEATDRQEDCTGQAGCPVHRDVRYCTRDGWTPAPDILRHIR